MMAACRASGPSAPWSCGWRIDPCGSLGLVFSKKCDASANSKSVALSGRFGILGRVPRLETRLKPWAESSCPFGAQRSIPAVHVQKNFLRVPSVSLVGRTKHGSRGKTGKGAGPLTFEVKPQAAKKQ
jgi:hypothetical protein